MLRGFDMNVAWNAPGDGEHIDLHTVFITLGLPQTLSWPNLRKQDASYYVGDMRSHGFDFSVEGNSNPHTPSYNFVRNSWVMDFFYSSSWTRGLTINHSFITGEYQIFYPPIGGWINFELHHSILRSVGYYDGNPGTKSLGPDFRSKVGNTWVHHNVFHAPRPISEKGKIFTESSRVATAHAAGIPSQSFKQWNNTWIFRPVVNTGVDLNFNTGYLHFMSHQRLAHDSPSTDYSLNSIVAVYPHTFPPDTRVGSMQGAPQPVKFFDQKVGFKANQSGVLTQFRDGNVYHGIGTGSGNLVKFMMNTRLPNRTASFDTLADFQQSADVNDIARAFGVRPEVESRSAIPSYLSPSTPTG